MVPSHLRVDLLLSIKWLFLMRIDLVEVCDACAAARVAMITELYQFSEFKYLVLNLPSYVVMLEFGVFEFGSSLMKQWFHLLLLFLSNFNPNFF